MVEKSADIQTLAPRLSYVEDLASYLKDNIGSGGGGGTDPSALLKKLYLSTIGLSHLGGGAFGEDIWDEESVYTDPAELGERSMHVAVFGFSAERKDLTNVETSFQNAKGFYNQVFTPGDLRWSGGSTDASLASDVFDSEDEYLGSLRTSGWSLVKAIFRDPSSIPPVGDDEATVIGRIEQLEIALEELATNIEEAVTSIQSDIASIDTQLVNIRSRLSALESA